MKPCGDAALQISLLSPWPPPDSICQDRSSSERRQWVRPGRITRHIDPCAGEQRMSAVSGLRQTFLLQQLPWNTQGSLLLCFLSSPLLLPFSCCRLPPSLSAKTIATDYPQGLSRVRGRTQKHSVYLCIWITGGLTGAVSEWSDLAPWLQCSTVVTSSIHFLFRKKK